VVFKTRWEFDAFPERWVHWRWEHVGADVSAAIVFLEVWAHDELHFVDTRTWTDGLRGRRCVPCVIVALRRKDRSDVGRRQRRGQ
jgi:hypothetical protein